VKQQKSFFNIKDVIAYFFVAGTGAAVQFVAGSILRNYVEYTPSVALGYIASFIVGFVLTKLFAFDARNSQQTQREMLKFGMVSLFSFWVTVYGSKIALQIINSNYDLQNYQLPVSFIPEKFKDIHLNESLALLIAMGFSFGCNYILHKTFTFRSTGFYERIKPYLPIKE
jgi:putative flippase GtrA